MEPVEIQQIVLMVGLVLAFGVLLCGSLLFMAFRINKAIDAREQEFLANWQQLAQSLGPAVTGPYRNGREWEIKGTYRGYPLAIQADPGGRNNQSFTTVTVTVAHQADFYFKASSRSKHLGIEYLPSGDLALDNQYNFLSQPPALMAQVAANQTICSLLHQVNCSWMLVSPYDMMCGVRGMEKDLQRLHAMINLSLAMTELVQAAVGTIIPQQPPRPPLDYLLVESVRIRVGRGPLLVGLVVGLVLIVGCIVAMSSWMSSWMRTL